MHQHDRDWILEQINSLPVVCRNSVLKRYMDIYSKEFEMEVVEQTKEGAARKAANQYLLEIVEIGNETLRGKVYEPDIMEDI
jgi:hypothetical protein